MPDRKLVFYSTVGPDQDDAAWRAFTMARRAVDAGLECEIVLAGPATGLMRSEARRRLQGRSAESFEKVQAAGVPVFLAPG